MVHLALLVRFYLAQASSTHEILLPQEGDSYARANGEKNAILTSKAPRSARGPLDDDRDHFA